MLKPTSRFLGLGAVSLALNGALFWWVFRLRRQNAALSAAREKAAWNLQNLQRGFHQFAPPRVVDEVISKGGSTSGESREVTVLFSDIVGFTAMSETLDPETLVGILNGFFRVASRAVSDNGGHVSKFLGDGFMAIFGAPETNVWHALDAVQASLALREAVQDYNAKLAERGLPSLDVRVGVHSGNVVAGVVGSDETLEYTVIGDAVNTAARIQELTRLYEVDILISDTVRPALDRRFEVRAMPPAHVKGKEKAVDTFSVERFREDQEPGTGEGT